jgi:epoxyqueuosine reductase
MIKQLKEEILRHGDKGQIVPIERLQEIKQDIEAIKTTGVFNGFQNFIVDKLYVLDVPKTDFEVRSIIIVATPRPLLAKIVVNYQGRRIPLKMPASYIGVKPVPLQVGKYLNDFLEPQGYQVKHEPMLPLKRLAVRSGLSQYGRNNITYVEGMGSSLMLTAYFSDLPCPEDSWREVCQMDLCKTCKACLKNCPTGAIMEDRFLIDNERCLTYFNESGSDGSFPEWIDPLAHNSIYGCVNCQVVCPQNKGCIDNIIEPMEFTEDETLLILSGKPIDEWPAELAAKVKAIDEVHDYSGLSRNLRVLLEREALISAQE